MWEREIINIEDPKKERKKKRKERDGIHGDMGWCYGPKMNIVQKIQT
jgi:hypothetical protein